MKKIGVILAAGLGTRLCPLNSQENTKPMFPVDEISLLLRTIHSHEVALCERVVIVVGWQAEAVIDHVKNRYNGQLQLEFVYNEHYFLKNGISVLSARDHVDEHFILTMADHILDDNIMKLLSKYSPPQDGALLCVDYKIDTIFDIDDATKVFVKNDLILNIGKTIKTYNCIDTGVFLCSQGLMDALSDIYKKNGDVSLSEGIQVLANKGLMKALDIKDCYWQDVDTPEMLSHAEKILKSNSFFSV